MTPADFIQKWGDSILRERQAAQEHFIDLCRLLGEPTPAEEDPFGDLPDDAVLERLFALNQERAAAGR